jgi:hypothetical protein
MWGGVGGQLSSITSRDLYSRQPANSFATGTNFLETYAACA